MPKSHIAGPLLLTALIASGCSGSAHETDKVCPEVFSPTTTLPAGAFDSKPDYTLKMCSSIEGIPVMRPTAGSQAAEIFTPRDPNRSEFLTLIREVGINEATENTKENKLARYLVVMGVWGMHYVSDVLVDESRQIVVESSEESQYVPSEGFLVTNDNSAANGDVILTITPSRSVFGSIIVAYDGIKPLSVEDADRVPVEARS